MPRLDRACCCLSLRTGSLVLGWISLLGSIACVGNYAAQLNEFDKDDPLRDTVIAVCGSEMVLFSITAITSGCLLHGIYNKRPAYMIPYLVASMMDIIGSLIITVIIVAFLPLFLLTSAVLAILLSIYFYVIIWSYYTELRSEQSQPRYP